MEKVFDQYTLRFLNHKDLADYYELIDTNRKRLEDFFAGTVAVTKDMNCTKQHLDALLKMTEENNYFPFIVVDNDTKKIVASAQVKNVDWSIPKAELGYYIDEQYEGKGIVSKTVAEIIEFCFTEKGINKLFIRTHERNMASRRVAEKNGFVLEATLQCEYKTTGGEIVDLMYYGLLHPELAK